METHSSLEFEAITYVLDGPDTSGDYTITATWQNGFSRPTGFPNPVDHPGWSVPAGEAKIATYTGNVEVGECELPVDLPSFAAVGSATCTNGTPDPGYVDLDYIDGATYSIQSSGTDITGTAQYLPDNESPQSVRFFYPGDTEQILSFAVTLPEGGEWNTESSNVGLWEIDGEAATLKVQLTMYAHECELDIAIEKSATGGSGPNGEFFPGDEIAYEVSLRNSGEAAVANVSVTDTYVPALEYKPDSLTYAGSVTGGCLPYTDDSEIGCVFSNVPAETGFVTINYTLVIPADGSVCGEVENTVEFQYEGYTGDANSDGVTIDVLCPELSLDKSLAITSDGDPVQGTEASVGDVLNFTITVTNTGDAAAQDVSFEDTLEAGLFGTSGIGWSITAQDGENCLYATGILTCDDIGLDPESDYTVTLTSDVITATNPVCGEYGNGVSFTGAYGDEGSVSGRVGTVSDPVEFGIECIPAVSIDKEQIPHTFLVDDVVGTNAAFPGDSVDPGDYIAYRLTMTNEGNVPLDLVTIIDNIPPELSFHAWMEHDGLECQHVAEGKITACEINPDDIYEAQTPPLAHGETRSAILIVQVVEGADTQTCEIVNELVLDRFRALDATHIEHPSTTVSAETDVNCVADWSVEKTSDTVGLKTDFVVGDEIIYTVTVDNIGPLPLEDMTLADEFSGDGNLEWATATLSGDPENPVTFNGVDIPTVPMGESIELVATYSVTQADINAGTITNCATANDIPAEDNGNCVTDSIDQNASVEFEIIATESSIAPGVDDSAVIEYTISVHNDGNITVDAAELTDDVLADLLPASPAGTAWTVAVESGGEYLDPTDQSNFPFTIADLPPGKEVEVKVSLTVPPDIELPDAEWCTPFSNTAELTGNFANGDVIGFDNDQNPATPNDPLIASATALVNCTGLSIEKSAIDAAGNPVTEDLVPGQQFSYQITVTNNGNVPVADISVSDQVPDALIIEGVESSFDDSGRGGEICHAPVLNFVECGPAILGGGGQSGDSVTITIDVKVPERGEIKWEQCTDISNSAVIDKDFGMMMAPTSGITPPGEADIWSDPLVLTIDCETGLTVEKSASDVDDSNQNGRVDAGETITYTFTLTNTGDVTLYNVEVIDPLVGLEWQDSSTIAELNLGESGSVTLTATYQISQDDIDSGIVENCADAVASTSSGEGGSDVATSRDEADRCTITLLTHEPGIEIDKQGTVDLGENTRADAGDVITYTFDVTNTGNVTLTDIAVADPLPGLTWNGENSVVSLAPGANITFTAMYSVTDADIEVGERANVASVSGTAPDPESVVHSFGPAFAILQQVNAVTDQDEVVIALEQVPGIALTVNGVLDPGADGRVGVNDLFTYTFTVTNTGNIALTNIVITDPLSGLTWHDDPRIASLAPGESATLTASYALTQPDLEAGTVATCADVAAGEDGPTAEACEETDVPYVPVATPDATPGETPVATPGETPAATPGETPAATPGETPVATPVETPAATPDGTTTPTTPVVDSLPQTGQGGMTAIASTLWAAAVLGVLMLGAAALGTRRKRGE